MSESVNLPALGESVTEGTVTQWLKAVGDSVEVDEPLVEISTDKVDTEIPSPIAGILEQILVQEDETVEVGAALAIIGDGSAAASEAAPVEEAVSEPEQVAEPVAEEAAPAPEPVQTIQQPEPVAAEETTASSSAAESQQDFAASNESYLTPIVRKLANDNNVDVQRISGTGVGGRITKEDVLQAIDAQQSSVPATSSVTPSTVSAAPVEVSALRGTQVPFTRLRKVVAKRAVESMQATAQLTTVVEVDVTEVARLRDRVKEDFFAKTGSKLSFMPFFALAAVEALQAFPIINSTVENETIIYPDTENLSIAVDTDRGLLTPVIKDASSLNIRGFAEQIADLADRTRTNKIRPDELSGGTFTLTNTGSRGALFDTPLVFLPQTAILGTGVVTKKPMVIGEGIQIRSSVYLALSYDHRIIDGADAARFLTTVKARLEAGQFEADLGL